MYKGWAGILFMGVLVACSSSALENTSAPTLAPAVISDTQSPTLSPTEPLPRRTPEPTPTEIPVFIDESTSPDGRYIVTTIRYGPYETDDGRYVDVSIFAKPVNGDVRTVLAEVSYPSTGLGESTPTFVGWSADGYYAYYTNREGGDGCVTHTNGNDLYKVDIRDGSQEQVLPAELREWRVSPDGTRLAYVNLWDTQITILDLTTQASTTIRGNDKPLIGIVWSPDSSRIAVTAYGGVCVEPTVNDIIIFDVMNFSRLVYPNPSDEPLSLRTGARNPDAWLNEDQILLRDLNNNKWILDLITGEFQSMPEGISP